MLHCKPSMKKCEAPSRRHASIRGIAVPSQHRRIRIGVPGRSTHCGAGRVVRSDACCRQHQVWKHLAVKVADSAQDGRDEPRCGEGQPGARAQLVRDISGGLLWEAGELLLDAASDTVMGGSNIERHAR